MDGNTVHRRDTSLNPKNTRRGMESAEIGGNDGAKRRVFRSRRAAGDRGKRYRVDEAAAERQLSTPCGTEHPDHDTSIIRESS